MTVMKAEDDEDAIAIVRYLYRLLLLVYSDILTA